MMTRIHLNEFLQKGHPMKQAATAEKGTRSAILGTVLWRAMQDCKDPSLATLS